jgi:hypothetical protein
LDGLKVIGDAILCGIDDWWDIWGDPLLSGTIFMVSYGVTALLIFRVSSGFAARERLYWRLCGGLFLLQFVNTNLDLHALVWTIGRCMAHAQEWYEYRNEVQVLFLVGIAIVIALILLTVLIVFSQYIFGNFLLTLGVTIALGLTISKGASFHGLEQYYRRELGPFQVADLIEYSGIVLAFLAVLIRMRQIRLKQAS